MTTPIRSIVLRNPQTGVYIREFMEETLAREIGRSDRHERPLSIATVVIDKFHDLETRFGPKVSEQIMTHVASRIHLALRQSDSLISQWGPDQFLICLMECNLRGAVTTLERLKSRVSCEPLHVLAHEIPVTLSVGIAALRPGIKAESLILEADHALRQAQKTGVNQMRYTEVT